MNEPRVLDLVESLRERYGRVVDAAQRGEDVPVETILQHARGLDELVEQLAARERQLDASADILANRINNLLMAVQTTADYLGATLSGDEIDRLRLRLLGTIGMGRTAFEEVRQVLLGLR